MRQSYFWVFVISFNVSIYSQDTLLFDNVIKSDLYKSDSQDISFENHKYIYYFNKAQVIQRLGILKCAESDLLGIILKNRNDQTRFSIITNSDRPIEDSVWRYGVYFDKIMPYLMQFIGFKIFDLKTNSFLQYKSLNYRGYLYKKEDCDGFVHDFRIDNSRIIYEDFKNVNCKEIFRLPVVIDTIDYDKNYIIRDNIRNVDE